MAKFTTRPVIMGKHGVIAAGHYLAAAAGFGIFLKGGNAIDAAVAAGFAETVVEPQENGIGGEAPILVYSADGKRVAAVNGQGIAPKRATVEWFKNEGIDVIPGDGFLPATVPGALDSWVTALANFGTMSLQQVIEPALELAENGYPIYPRLRNTISTNAEKYKSRWPTTAKIYMLDGNVPDEGYILRNPDLAVTFRRLIDAERKGSRAGRKAGLEAARDEFYKGEIARRIADFAAENEVLDSSGKKHRGLIRYEDLADYHARLEEPVSVDYRGYRVYKCGPWCQGPVFLQQLTILEGYNLASLGHNSPNYIHTVIEAAKLAFADRDAYYGDPQFVRVPLDRLLSKEYAAGRRKLIDPEVASLELRPGGGRSIRLEQGRSYPGIYVGDTTKVDAIDRWGNMISATPSGGWIPTSPVIEGLGFPLGTRGQMFSLDPKHPNALMPGKRPRTTLTPSLVTKDGLPFMVFGTPGGDCQDQWALLFFLNFIDFGMSLQEAVDAPLFHTTHFPSSFYPRHASPGHIGLEGRIPAQVREALAAKGHKVNVGEEWAGGKILAVRFDHRTGLIQGAASPRVETGYAIGW